MRWIAWMGWLPGLLAVAAGAGCPRTIFRPSQAPPRLLSERPTLAEVAAVVNANSSRVQSIYAPTATADMPGAPALRAQIAFQRPYRFRMVANFMGPVVDIGSNDQVFWLWSQQEDVLYYCPHDSFAQSTARQILPVEPAWLADAFGLLSFNPADRHGEPVPWGGGRLRVDSIRHGPLGQTTRVAILDANSGWVLEQHVYDAQRRRIASARSSRHWTDPVTGATLALRTQIDWPTTGMGITVDLGPVTINDPLTDSARRWEMPQHERYVNLANPSPFAQPPGDVGSTTVSDFAPLATREAPRWRPSRPSR